MVPRTLLIESFHSAVGAADPLNILPQHLPQPPAGKTLVVGAGKAAAAMALAVEQHWPSAAALDGLGITRYRHGLLTNRIKVIEAGHPVPDESGEKAAREILRRTKTLGPNDLLLALVSGGGSSLLSLPAEGIGMDELKATTKELLRCGAPIQRIVYATNETNYCARCQTGCKLLADRALSRLLKKSWPRSIDKLE